MIHIFFVALFTLAITGVLHSQDFLLDEYSGIQMAPDPAQDPSGDPCDFGGGSPQVGLGLQSQDAATPIATIDSVAVDTGFQALKPRLLPENISFMERGLWGENGFFRKIGIASPLSPETRKSEIALRRTMLTLHQIGGFVTLGLMVGSVYTGQQIIDGREQFRGAHQAFVVSTIGSYSVTALLSVLSPPPLIRRDEMSTTTIHKTLAWVHFAGMILTPILASAIDRRSSSFEEKARIHQVSAYITTGTFALSMIVLFF